ncbi:hypothetical protein KC360_g162 [Hortaea werneckii]|nr:hypothetical protein KC344_g164 [Hortaea werneckii]KAI7180410.1 hypothetical protein KC360_g162 [Hortaea werneckii]
MSTLLAVPQHHFEICNRNFGPPPVQCGFEPELLRAAKEVVAKPSTQSSRWRRRALSRPRSNSHTTLIDLLLAHAEPIPRLLLPALAITVLLVELPDRVQTRHILADTRADLLHGLIEVALGQGPFLWELEIGLAVLLVPGDQVVLFAHAGERGGDAEVLEIGAGVERGLLGEVGEGD